MKIGLHISDFSWDGGVSALPGRLAEIARRAEDAGVDRVSVMDHVWQIGHIGPPEHEIWRPTPRWAGSPPARSG